MARYEPHSEPGETARLKGTFKVILVVGAISGIGAGLTRELGASRGASDTTNLILFGLGFLAFSLLGWALAQKLWPSETHRLRAHMARRRR
jgi:hypothetical protein